MDAKILINEDTITLQGALTRHTLPAFMRDIPPAKATGIKQIDLRNVSRLDSAGVAFLDEIRARFGPPQVPLINVPATLQTTIDTFSSEVKPLKEERIRINIFERIGASLIRLKEAFIRVILLTSDVTLWSFIGIFSKRSQRRGSVIQQGVLIGVNALGIISLLSLILGLILALQSAAQLRQFGANIFVADLIAISMVREMAPMMTAIIIAGRSGSSFAAEIATMKVTEELDALKMMAINPIRYVVVPKMHAITLCMPLLVTLSMIIGIVGGFIIGVTYLDLTLVSYFNETVNVLNIKDLLVGLSKSVVFAWVIVIIGSYFGFNVKGGAEEVGKATTRAVVASIFAVILLDALFSLLYMI